MDEFHLTDREFQLFRRLIQAEAGISLGEHKRELVRSRLTRRLRVHGCRSFQEYYDRLTAGEWGEDERVRMLNAITTNKTDFYREKAHFDFLAAKVVPGLKAAAAKTGERRVRIWSAGCSTGEEPYTIAITLRESLGNLLTWDVRILASDIDTDVLDQAARGIYAAERVAEIPERILQSYFRRGTGAHSGLVQVTQEVRRLVTFRRINFLEEPWPIRVVFDCIFCRNVMIYFDKATQRRLVERFAGCLKDGGHLFLGHSESLFGMSDQFAFLHNTIHRKLGTGRAAGRPTVEARA
ncbi:MAG TPA: protein-glutamate O-methyltransferase CheR [Candidatus Methylomirabilis sp.]|nr:protein-glutamate O-methyltransferase CheR [Candidatus Methylomirabilis sp.]